MTDTNESTLQDLISKAQETWEDVKDVSTISNSYQKKHSEALNNLERELEEDNSEENSEEDEE